MSSTLFSLAVNAVPYQILRVKLANKSLIIKIKWNEFDDKLYCVVFDTNNNVIIPSQRMIINSPLIYTREQYNNFGGLMYLYSEVVDPAYNYINLGKDIKLIFEVL